MILLIIALVLLWFVGARTWQIVSLRAGANSEQQGSLQGVGTLICCFFIAFLVSEFWGYFVGSLNPFLILSTLVALALPFALQKKDWRIPHFVFRKKKLTLSHSFILILVAFLALEALFYSTENPFKRTTDGFAYHLPRIIEWFQRGNTRWIFDSPVLRFNYIPRLVHVLSAVVLTFTESMRLSLLPVWIASVGFLLFTMRSMMESVLENKSEWALACTWLVTAIAISVSPVLLQLRAGMADGAYFGILSAFLALLAWRGPAELRFVGSLLVLLLALGQKHTGLISLPMALLLLLLDRPIREMLLRRRQFTFLAFVFFLIGCVIFSLEYVENFWHYQNPFYPAPVKFGPFNFSGSGRALADYGYHFVGKSSPLQNLFEGWKYIFLALISRGPGGLDLLDADVGGYGPGIRIMFLPMILGWIYAVKKSEVIRRISFRVFLLISTMIVLHKELENCLAHTRYYTIAIIPLLLGMGFALYDIFKHKRRWQLPMVLLLSAWLTFTFFKVASAGHHYFKRDLVQLPMTAAQFTPAWVVPPPRPLNVLVLSYSPMAWNAPTFEYYGRFVKNKVHIREVPLDRPKEDPVDSDAPIFVPQAKADFANLYSEASRYDLIVMDSVPVSLLQFYREAFVQKGWLLVDRLEEYRVFDIDFPQQSSVPFILLSPGLQEGARP